MKKILLLAISLLLASCGWQNVVKNSVETTNHSWATEKIGAKWKKIVDKKENIAKKKISPVKKKINTQEETLLKKLSVSLSTTGVIYQSWNLIWLLKEKTICLKQNTGFLCKNGNIKDLINRNWKIFFKNILTLDEIQNNNYKPVKSIVYRCNGSLYQTKNGKNLPWYYCKTNGKNFLEQYEFIGGEWNKICIKRLWGKDYFEIKKLGNLNWQVRDSSAPLYSKKILDRLLKNNDTNCKILKQLISVPVDSDLTYEKNKKILKKWIK